MLNQSKTQDVMLHYLRKKIVEEAREAACATSREHLIEELSDCLEIISACAYHLGVDFSHITLIQEQKRSEKGGFQQLRIVDRVILTHDDPLHDWYFRKYSDSVVSVENNTCSHV